MDTLESQEQLWELLVLNLESVGFIAYFEGVSGFTNSACVGGHHVGVSASEVIGTD